jgi:hypothetical protein
VADARQLVVVDVTAEDNWNRLRRVGTWKRGGAEGEHATGLNDFDMLSEVEHSI